MSFQSSHIKATSLVSICFAKAFASFRLFPVWLWPVAIPWRALWNCLYPLNTVSVASAPADYRVSGGCLGTRQPSSCFKHNNRIPHRFVELEKSCTAGSETQSMKQLQRNNPLQIDLLDLVSDMHMEYNPLVSCSCFSEFAAGRYICQTYCWHVICLSRAVIEINLLLNLTSTEVEYQQDSCQCDWKRWWTWENVLLAHILSCWHDE